MPAAAGHRALSAAALLLLLGGQVLAQNYEADIKKAILVDVPYDRTSRPPSHLRGDTVVTQVTLLMRSFQIDEFQLTATINAWTIMVWHDPRLTWQPSDHGNTYMVFMYSSQVWLPDIYLMNGVSHMDPIYTHVPVPVSYTGTVVWVTPSTFRVRCQKELANWPYDQQNCTAILSSWSLDVDAHQVVPAHPDGSLVMSNDMAKTDSHWRVADIKGYLVNATYNCCPHTVWHELHVELHVARVSLLYAMSFILPAVALAVHVLLVFWIPPESSAKVKVATIHSMALIFFMFNLFWWMPPVGGNSVPKLVSFVSGCLVMSVVSAVAAAVAANLVTRQQSPPAPLLALFTGIAGTVLLLADLTLQLQGTRAPFAEDGAPVQDKEATGAIRRAEWRLVAAGADRCVCLVQLAVFVFLALACLT